MSLLRHEACVAEHLERMLLEAAVLLYKMLYKMIAAHAAPSHSRDALDDDLDSALDDDFDFCDFDYDDFDDLT